MKAITHPDTRRLRSRSGSRRRGGDAGSLKLWIAVLGIVGLPALVLATHSTPGPGLTNAWNRLEAVTLVPAHMPCLGFAATTTHNAPLALPACLSPAPTSALRLGPSAPIGRGRMRIRKIGPANAPDVLVAVQLLNVQDPSGAFGPPGAFTGTLNVVIDLRISDHDCVAAAPCSVIDFSFPIPVPCAAGACALTTTMNTVLPGAVSAGTDAVLEVGQLRVIDPSGKDFLRQGIFVL